MKPNINPAAATILLLIATKMCVRVHLNWNQNFIHVVYLCILNRLTTTTTSSTLLLLTIEHIFHLLLFLFFCPRLHCCYFTAVLSQHYANAVDLLHIYDTIHLFYKLNAELKKRREEKYVYWRIVLFQHAQKKST